jgi:hypothetical protein
VAAKISRLLDHPNRQFHETAERNAVLSLGAIPTHEIQVCNLLIHFWAWCL